MMAPPPWPPSPPSPLPALPEELVEEILLRFPPSEPASLFRAALVCKPWCCLISGARFRRRFRELHRTPPMLGFFGNTGYTRARFVPTTAFCPLRADRFDWDALDAHHGRVLVRRYAPEDEEGDDVLVVWDPITDEQRELLIPPLETIGWTAAVLCAGAGVCHHLDCHRGPFLVVFVGFDPNETFVCTYSSDVGAWSEPISTHRHRERDTCFVDPGKQAVLVGNALYFGIMWTNISLKYNFESREMSWIQLPFSDEWAFHHRWQYVLTSTAEGVLGLVTVAGSKLCMWLRKDAPEVDAGWTQNGLVILFMKVGSVLYSIDVKTCKMELYQDRETMNIFPYMSFYTPGEEP